jgi:wobble nucleotide-excising tRNase
MIRRVQRSTSFGVFEDFTWPSGLHEFKQFNPIFGWNYSGKTTFSRAFRCFELLKRHPDFDKAEVHLQCGDSSAHTLSTTTGPHHYRVFNVDFVRDNIRFDEGVAEPILILGATDIAKQSELKGKQEALAAPRDEIRSASRARHEIEGGLDKVFIAAARDNIKTPLKRLNYDKNQFASRVDLCKAAPEKGILSDSDFARAWDIYNSTDKKALIPSLPKATFTSLSSLAGRLAEPSSRSVKSVTIKALADSPELEQWVNKGRALHERKTDCQFCGGPLPADLLSRPADHFSTEYDNLMSDLKRLERELIRAKAEAPQLPQSGFFYIDLSASFEHIANEIDQLLNHRRASLDVLLETVNRKKVMSFAAFPGPIPDDNASAIGDSLAQVALLIRK